MISETITFNFDSKAQQRRFHKELVERRQMDDAIAVAII